MITPPKHAESVSSFELFLHTATGASMMYMKNDELAPLLLAAPKLRKWHIVQTTSTVIISGETDGA